MKLGSSCLTLSSSWDGRLKLADGCILEITALTPWLWVRDKAEKPGWTWPNQVRVCRGRRGVCHKLSIHKQTWLHVNLDEELSTA